MTKRDRRHVDPAAGPTVTEAYDALHHPYRAANEASAERAMSTGSRPRSAMGYVRWARSAYSAEPPVRLHVREAGEGGGPALAPAFEAWLRGAEEQGVACGTDQAGYYRTPLRCALYLLHGRDEASDGAGMAHFALAVATSNPVEPLVDLCDLAGVPRWLASIATERALGRLWDLAVPTSVLRR